MGNYNINKLSIKIIIYCLLFIHKYLLGARTRLANRVRYNAFVLGKMVAI